MVSVANTGAGTPDPGASAATAAAAGAVAADTTEPLTVIGFGSLLSERSARSTFPDLTDFRLARLRGFRRVFRHPAGVFFERGIVPESDRQQCSSLSVEPCEKASCVVAVMKLPGLDMAALQKREEEYDLVKTDFYNLDGEDEKSAGSGLMCLPLKDDSDFIRRWGEERFQVAYGQYGIKCIWNEEEHRNILPCPVYLRHCVLAAKKAGEVAENSFLDDTFLVDRKTSIRQYLEARPDIMDLQPPDNLKERYNG
mmetsp:Transcript_54316/g.115941  ORF Transcript_54316/g.115941 Transcript_54316/m.115941 type:complete len:254 (-) Transcript_54316:79-840(-)